MQVIKKLLFLSFLVLLLIIPAQASNYIKPKLIVLIVADQFAYNYLNRFKSKFNKRGFNYLLNNGSDCVNCKYAHATLQTACGHSIISTGAYPWATGIIANQWYDRAKKSVITSVSDPSCQVTGGNGYGASPHLLNSTTIGDEMKLAFNNQSKVISVSIKDRVAVLLAGRLANLAIYYDDKTGNFITSSHYANDLPFYLKDFNEKHIVDNYCAKPWERLLPEANYTESRKDDYFYEQGITDDGKKFPHSIASSPIKYQLFPLTPFANDTLTQIAKTVMEKERMGTHDKTDLLCIGYSAGDYIGHSFGPYSQESEDLVLRLDNNLQELFNYIDAGIGLKNTLIVFTADHGISPIPEYLQEIGLPGGRIDYKQMTNSLNASLASKLGKGEWVEAFEPPNLYLNLNTIDQNNVHQQDVEALTANLVHGFKGVSEVFTANQFYNNKLPNSPYANAARKSYYFGRSGELFVILKPGYIFSTSNLGTNHGTPYRYDAQVPLIFCGTQIKPKTIFTQVAPCDIAPTILSLLDLEFTSNCEGKVINLDLNECYGPINQ